MELISRTAVGDLCWHRWRADGQGRPSGEHRWKIRDHFKGSGGSQDHLNFESASWADFEGSGDPGATEGQSEKTSRAREFRGRITAFLDLEGSGDPREQCGTCSFWPRKGSVGAVQPELQHGCCKINWKLDLRRLRRSRGHRRTIGEDLEGSEGSARALQHF